MRTPTLLVFTLGAQRRALLPRGLRGVETGLWRECLEGVLEAGRAQGCRLEVCSPGPLALPADVFGAPQAGSGFGPRLERALLDAFGRGSGPLLVVGTDVPGLAPEHLARAAALLADDPDRVVLGPCPDGGFYLLASSRPIPGLATAARWCRRDTLRTLIASLEALGRPVVLLDPLEDLDRPRDLERWLARAARWAAPRWRHLVGRLQDELRALSRPLDAPARRLAPVAVRPRAGRAPPAPRFR